MPARARIRAGTADHAVDTGLGERAVAGHTIEMLMLARVAVLDRDAAPREHEPVSVPVHHHVPAVSMDRTVADDHRDTVLGRVVLQPDDVLGRHRAASRTGRSHRHQPRRREHRYTHCRPDAKTPHDYPLIARAPARDAGTVRPTDSPGYQLRLI